MLPLTRDEFLDEIARQHSQYMVEHGLGHQNFEERCDIIVNTMGAIVDGENCICSPLNYHNAHSLAKGWYESTGHRVNMLSSFSTRTGMGVAAGKGNVYATQIFTN